MNIECLKKEPFKLSGQEWFFQVRIKLIRFKQNKKNASKMNIKDLVYNTG